MGRIGHRRPRWPNRERFTLLLVGRQWKVRPVGRFGPSVEIVAARVSE